MHYLIIFQLMIIYLTCASEPFNLTDGFLSLPLNQSNLVIQRPYDVPEDQRYSFIDGVHKLWVYSTDKPHSPTSKSHPRTEIRIHLHPFMGSCQIVCIMQVFGASPHATTLMLRVSNGTLSYYRDGVLKFEATGRGGKSHYFKCGVYAQNDETNSMESRWKGIKVLKKI
ncbi:citrate-binding protein-like [Fagus crenata]